MEVVLKVGVGGAGGVGKTTILHRYLHNTFIDDTSMTIGVQFHTQRFNYGNNHVTLQLWDMGGQDRFRFLLESYARGATGAYVLFSIDDIDTTNDVMNWIDLFKKNMDETAPVLLVGTKMDLAFPEQIEQAREFASKIVNDGYCIGYVETSSKNGYNVEMAIETLLNSVLVAMFG